MNRSKYFDFIEYKLSLLATRIEHRGGLNILDLHLHSESFYLHFLNLLFGWKLQNLNEVKKNIAGIDLIDRTNNIIIQVSATATMQKIEAALSRDLSIYNGYYFKFVSISKDADRLRTRVYKNPHKLTFQPATDIFDISSILVKILNMDIDQQQIVYEFLKKELKRESDPEKIESNLTTIIKILSKVDWSLGTSGFEVVPYDIEAKISYNQLNSTAALIDDYKIHYHRIDKIYSDFNRQGVNKSISILNGIRREYLALGTIISPDQCFLMIIDKVIQKIIESANYTPMPEEELRLCVEILVVDAFIRCKVFKNPAGNTDAHS